MIKFNYGSVRFDRGAVWAVSTVIRATTTTVGCFLRVMPVVRARRVLFQRHHYSCHIFVVKVLRCRIRPSGFGSARTVIDVLIAGFLLLVFLSVPAHQITQVIHVYIYIRSIYIIFIHIFIHHFL